MRLIENLDVRGCSSSEVLVLVRHGIDSPILSKELDQPLVEETKPDIKVLGMELVRFYKKVNAGNVFLKHSNRLRAIQTALILTEEFVGQGISTVIMETPEVREIYQGDFVIKGHVHGTEYKPLVDAWTAWQKKLDACELLYRFGDPLMVEGKAQFPELEGWFLEFGEHQAEFSLRLYRMIRSVFESEDDCLQIIVGHQASCSRIQRVISSISHLESADDFNPGDFVRFLEKKGSRVSIDPACAVAINKSNRDLVRSVLVKEITYLESII